MVKVERVDKMPEVGKMLVCSVFGFSHRVLIPKQHEDRLRPLIKKSQVKEIWKILRGTPQKMDSNHKKKNRSLQEAIKGTSEEVAAIIRDVLHGRKKPIGLEEGYILKKALAQFTWEVSIVSKRKHTEVIDEVFEVFGVTRKSYWDSIL